MFSPVWVQVAHFAGWPKALLLYFYRINRPRKHLKLPSSLLRLKLFSVALRFLVKSLFYGTGLGNPFNPF